MPSPAPAPAAKRGVADPDEAREFLAGFHRETAAAGRGEEAFEARWREVRTQIDRSGTYTHTLDELTWGARVAWRNSARCIGRLYWNSLHIRDRRGMFRVGDVAAECVEHLRSTWRGGRIRPTITVFAPDTPDQAGPRIWNEQLVRYAGYVMPDGTRVGDGRTSGITTYARSLGWRGPGGRFDVLPLIVEHERDGVRWFPLPRNAVHEVPITHPEYPQVAELDLRWHAVPAIANMRLEIGGVTYGAAPFNGWYMQTEIGARNLVDADRYDVLPDLARLLGLDTSSERTLWRDRALVELNRAVLHSFDTAGAAITDHHTESERFLRHLGREEDAGRGCPADWSWIVPPVSGGLTPVYHRYYDAYDEAELRPAFVLDDEAVQRARGETPVREG
ncbi:nitric oxide synthase oxygenase [Yinghuangia seranimata]|nr:nitric oxide synthase oxygenase [Yinghuangia seranimata]MDI2130340.1 nitric oxide synthase oxygenase [Yinghuangia seranimata]